MVERNFFGIAGIPIIFKTINILVLALQQRSILIGLSSVVFVIWAFSGAALIKYLLYEPKQGIRAVALVSGLHVLFAAGLFVLFLYLSQGYGLLIVARLWV